MTAMSPGSRRRTRTLVFLSTLATPTIPGGVSLLPRLTCANLMNGTFIDSILAYRSDCILSAGNSRRVRLPPPRVAKPGVAGQAVAAGTVSPGDRRVLVTWRGLAGRTYGGPCDY